MLKSDVIPDQKRISKKTLTDVVYIYIFIQHHNDTTSKTDA